MTDKLLAFSPRGTRDLDAQLRSAIAGKRLLRFEYEGAVRIGEPHDYGVREGTPRVLVFQQSKAGEVGKSDTGWRLLSISKIKNCSVLDDTFPGTRGDEHKDHYVWDVLYARVE